MKQEATLPQTPSSRHARAPWGLASALTLALALSGCGGGGSDSGGGGGGGGGSTAPSNLSYTTTGSLFLAYGTPLAPIAPSVQGAPTGYVVQPALPAGLTLDAASGVIAGTPAARAQRATYQITATNDLGSAATLLDVEVVGPTRFAYVTCEGDDTIAIYAQEQTDGRLRFHGYHPQGAGESGPRAIAVHPDGLAAYVSNDGSGSLSVHTLDPATGRVQSTTVSATGPGAHDLALLASGRFLYLSSSTAGTIVRYAVDAQDGSLTPQGAPTAVAFAPARLLADPMERTLVALGESGAVQSFLVDPASGALTAGAQSAAGAGALAGAAFAPTGEALYVTLEGPDSVRHMTVDPQTGALQQGAAQPAGSAPTAPTVHPKGGFVYVPDADTGDLRRYSVSPTTGALTPVGTTSSAAGAERIGFDSMGEYVYALDTDGATIRTFRFDDDGGGLTELSRRRTHEAPAAFAFAAGDDALDVEATHLYVANQGAGTLSMYSISAVDGTLTELTPAASAAGQPVDVALDPLGRYAFAVTTTPPQIRSYRVEANGRLTPFATPLALTGSPRAITVEPTGRWAYVTDVTDGEVELFSIAAQYDPGGVLTALGARDAGTFPVDVAVDPSGQFLYVVEGEGSNITIFEIDAGTGALAPAPAGQTFPKPTTIAFSPGGDRAYVTMPSGNFIAPYQLDAATGAMTFTPPGSRAPNGPVDIELSASGRYAYSTVFGGGGVVVFDVRDSDGALFNEDAGFFPTGYYVTGTEPIEVLASPDEGTLYVLNQGAQSVSVLAIDGADGQLTPLQSPPTGTTPSAVEMAVRIE